MSAKKKMPIFSRWMPLMLLPIFILVIVVTVGAGPKITGGTTTPIQHVVIIFQENNSFDHYFATYPKTITDSNGNVIFQPKPNSPTINGLNADLLTNNQNSAQPFLLTSVSTCDQDNAYTAEQEAYDKGAADEFVEFTEGTGCAVPYENMGYYDGSTVTALWNYAQNYAMSDNFYGTTFGPTLLGHLNLSRMSYSSGVAHLAMQLADALAFSHSRGVCHRDLKPSNILVTPGGKPMLLDFNLSSDQQAYVPHVGGTLPYMAPRAD